MENSNTGTIFKFTDSHCHLNYDYDGRSLESVLAASRDANVTRWINVGVEVDKFEEVSKIANENENIYFSVGVHPHEAKHFQHSDLDVMRPYTKNPKCVAIGELGIDTHYENSSLDEQLQALHSQLQFANEVNLPVIVHSRENEDRLLEELSAFAKTSIRRNGVGVLHCFTGTKEFAHTCIDLGFFVSFSGILTFKNAQSVRDVAASVPIDRILVETDSPFLAPIPFRGKKCEPAMMIKTAEALASVRGVSLAELATATWNNTSTLFSIK